MTETTATRTEPTAVKQLRRSRDDRKIAGVCGGVARYLNVDATAVRVLFVVSVFFTAGWALLAYLATWMIMPEEQLPTYGPTPTGTTAPTYNSPVPAYNSPETAFIPEDTYGQK